MNSLCSVPGTPTCSFGAATGAGLRVGVAAAGGKLVPGLPSSAGRVCADCFGARVTLGDERVGVLRAEALLGRGADAGLGVSLVPPADSAGDAIARRV